MMRMSEAAFAAHQRMYSRNPTQLSLPQATPSSTSAQPACTLWLPLPPSVNDAWIFDKETRTRHLTDKHREYRKVVAEVAAIERRGAEPLAGRLVVRVDLHFANHRRTDVDGRLKPLLDALTEARVYKDDSQIDRLSVERIVADAPEHCGVQVMEIAA